MKSFFLRNHNSATRLHTLNLDCEAIFSTRNTSIQLPIQ